MEKYLDKCVSSIIEQTYKNLEIILVDDGATDNSLDICYKYQKKDLRIKIIQKRNGGLSQARNVGLKIAQGDYIGFVDGDDWLEPNMYEILMSSLQETKADIAICSYQRELDDTTTINEYEDFPERKLFSGEEALRMIFQGADIIHINVWNKLYRKASLKKIFFVENKICEDILWTPQVIGNANLLVYIDYPLYHYRIRSESLYHNENLRFKRTLDSIELLKIRNNYIHIRYPQFDKIAKFNFVNFLFSEYINIGLNNNHLDHDGEIRRALYREFCQSGIKNIIDLDNCRMTLFRILFRISPKYTLKIYKIHQKIKCM